MKLRCTTNSIRIRIRKSELKTLASDGRLTDTVRLSPQTVFSYALLVHEGPSIKVDYAHNTLTVLLPQKVAAEWMNSDLISIERQLTVSDNDSLHILIEKDFPCKDRDEENFEDFFHELSNEPNDTC